MIISLLVLSAGSSCVVNAEVRSTIAPERKTTKYAYIFFIIDLKISVEPVIDFKEYPKIVVINFVRYILCLKIE